MPPTPLRMAPTLLQMLAKGGLYASSRLGFRSSIQHSAVLSLPSEAGGRAVSKVFPSRKLSNDHDCCRKRGQEEEEE